MYFLLSVVGDGQEAGSVDVRAKRVGAETADTSAQHRGRRVTESPRRARAICFTICRGSTDPATRYDNHSDAEHAQREFLNVR